jgi:hypothetical protein
MPVQNNFELEEYLNTVHIKQNRENKYNVYVKFSKTYVVPNKVKSKWFSFVQCTKIYYAYEPTV